MLRLGFRRERTGVQPETRRLPLPAFPERLAVDVALGRAGHQRGALGKTLVVRGVAAAALGDRGLDLLAPCRERLHDLARDARDLEAPVGMGLLDAVSDPRKPLRELAAVERAEQHLRLVEPLVRHRAPLAVLVLAQDGDPGGDRQAKTLADAGGWPDTLRITR